MYRVRGTIERERATVNTLTRRRTTIDDTSDIGNKSTQNTYRESHQNRATERHHSWHLAQMKPTATGEDARLSKPHHRMVQVRAPGHLPTVHPSTCALLDKAHDWYVRLNHMEMLSVQRIALEHPALGLPPAMASITILMRCGGCATSHMQQAPHVVM